MLKLMVEYEKQEDRVLQIVEDIEQQLKLKVEKVTRSHACHMYMHVSHVTGTGTGTPGHS